KPFEIMERCRIGQVDVLDLDFTIGCFYANNRRGENSMNPDPHNVLVPYVCRPKTQEPRRNCYGIVRQCELAPPSASNRFRLKRKSDLPKPVSMPLRRSWKECRRRSDRRMQRSTPPRRRSRDPKRT